MLSKSLPTGYTQLEYIESTGTQYFDTGVYPSDTLNYDIEFEIKSETPAEIFGASRGAGVEYQLNRYSGGYVCTGSYAYYIAISLNAYQRAILNGTEYKIYSKSALLNSSTVDRTGAENINLSIFMFAGNRYGVAGEFSETKMYSCKFYDGNVLVRNFIPAKRESDNVVGMYDVVEDKFYTNAGSGTFTAGAETMAGAGVDLAYDSNKTNNKVTTSDLPAGYTQLEYLQSDGNQKFDTGIKPTSNMRFVGKSYFQRPTTSADNYLFGSGDHYSNFVGLMATRGSFWAGTGSASTSIVDDFPTIENYYTFNFDYSYNETTAILNSNLGNGTLTYSDSTLTTENIHLFHLKADYYGANLLVRFYSFTMYSESVMVRNFVPAKNASGVLGMYDLVEGKFYTNQGAGAFAAGAEIDGATNQLKLLLKNEDLGSSFGVRYKVNFYAATATGKVLLTSSISGMTAPTADTNGFVYDSDGWYYYRNNSGKNVMFEPATADTPTTKYLMQSFAIDYSSVSNLFGGNSIFMEILVESVDLS